MIHSFTRHQLPRCLPNIRLSTYRARCLSTAAGTAVETAVKTRTKAKIKVEGKDDATTLPSSKPPITPGSQNHTSLSSFLTYAQTVSLSPTSTVYIGTHYEYTVALSLRRLGFALTRTGRASDQGIDLLGHWRVPSLPAHAPLRVLLQCKARARKLSPETVRELEGAFAGAPAGWRGDGVLGLLVAAKEASKGVREALGRSRWPMGFMMVGLDGRVGQFLWNRVASEKGLEGVGVAVRYLPGAGGGGEEEGEVGEVKREVVLTWDGRALPDVEGGEEVREGTVPSLEVADQVQEVVPVKRKRGRPRKAQNVQDTVSCENAAG